MTKNIHLSKAVLAWTPDVDGRGLVKVFQLGEPIPEAYICTSGAAWIEYRTMSSGEQLTILLATAFRIIFQGIAAESTLEALKVIPEISNELTNL